MITVIVAALVAQTASADPPLPLRRLPICGDQDGSETPFRFRCLDFFPTTDVQTYRVQGEGDIDLRFDFVFREAAFNNELVVFVADDPGGSVDGLNPGDAGYLAAAFDRATVIFPSGSTAFTLDVTLTFQGGDILVFFIVQNNTFANLLVQNPNSEIGKLPLAFFSLDALNPDGVEHFVGFQSTTDPFTQFGFEDLTGGGDADYDDIVYNVRPPLEAIPLALQPVILLPGFIGSEIVTTDTIDLSVDDGHGGTWEHTYSSGEKVWINLLRIAARGHDDYFDVLKFEADGRTPLTIALRPSNLVKQVAVLKFYDKWVPFFESHGYELGVTLFEFPYDFRQDITLTAGELDAFVLDALRAANDGEEDPARWEVTRVNLVGHSMGTIVIREYVREPERAQRVHRVIALGPAYLGAPKFLKALIFGDDVVAGLLNSQEVKDLVQNWPGAMEVGPSRIYWEFYDGSTSALLVPFREDRDFDGDGRPPVGGAGVNLDYDETRALLANVGTNMSAFGIAEGFHDRLDQSWDAGLPVPEVHIIAGTNICSPGQLRAYWGLNIGPIRLFPKVDLLHVNGDGTVPLFSATLEDTTRGIDHNSTAEAYYAPNIYHADSFRQKDVASSDLVLQLVASILRGNPVIPEGITQTQTGSCSGKVVSVESPVELNVFDSEGNHTGLTAIPDLPDQQALEQTGIPGSTYDEILDAKFVYLPGEGVYTIQLLSEGEGSFDLRIRVYDSNLVETMILYLRVPLTATTRGEAIYDTGSSEPPILRLDLDADGTFDEEISATSVLGGAESADIQAPSIQILSPSDGQTLAGGGMISWVVEDDLSGVLNEFGLLDQDSAVENGSTLMLDAGEHTLTVFAEDRAGTATQRECRFVILPFEWLPPVSTTDPYVAKVGRTIPVKFRVLDLAGSPVRDETVELRLVDDQGNMVAGPFFFAADPTEGVTIQGNGMYHHNLRTSDLSEGTYALQVMFNSADLGGSVQRALILH